MNPPFDQDSIQDGFTMAESMAFNTTEFRAKLFVRCPAAALLDDDEVLKVLRKMNRDEYEFICSPLADKAEKLTARLKHETWRESWQKLTPASPPAAR